MPSISSLAYRMLEEYGETHDPSDAGYMLEHGELVSFTGGHLADSPIGGRNLDHRQLSDAIIEAARESLGEEVGRSRVMWWFQSEALAIRMKVSPRGFAGVSVVQMPTAPQLGRLSRLFGGGDGTFEIDVHDSSSGDVIHSMALERDYLNIDSLRQAFRDGFRTIEEGETSESMSF